VISLPRLVPLALIVLTACGKPKVGIEISGLDALASATDNLDPFAVKELLRSYEAALESGVEKQAAIDQLRSQIAAMKVDNKRAMVTIHVMHQGPVAVPVTICMVPVLDLESETDPQVCQRGHRTVILDGVTTEAGSEAHVTPEVLRSVRGLPHDGPYDDVLGTYDLVVLYRPSLGNPAEQEHFQVKTTVRQVIGSRPVPVSSLDAGIKRGLPTKRVLRMTMSHLPVVSGGSSLNGGDSSTE